MGNRVLVNRIGQENINYEGYRMKIIKYNNNRDMTVEFQDEYRTVVHTRYEFFSSGKVHNPNHINHKGRLGEERFNNNGELMKIIEYNGCNDVIVEFQDEHKRIAKITYSHFLDGRVMNPHKKEILLSRLGEEKINIQGCLMKIVEYNNSRDIVVEFQDQYKHRIKTRYAHFIDGLIKNPFHPHVRGVGMLGNMYGKVVENGECIREYCVWGGMLNRCFDEKEKAKNPTYKDVTCCDQWLLFENFYDWLHLQDNFNQWNDSFEFELDKDILIKGNKIYSPETCCLVPRRINYLFIKKKSVRGDLPIGVIRHENKYVAQCNDINCNHHYIGIFDTPEEAFIAYKQYKESIIKQVAEEEYDKGNITKQCYEAMMKYEVEITD